MIATLPDDEDFKDAVAKLKEFTGLDVRIMTQGDGDDNLPWFPQDCFQNYSVFQAIARTVLYFQYGFHTIEYYGP